MTIQISIDGKQITTTAGKTLVDVAAENGIYIPTLCYVKNKTCLGTCRVCSVKVSGNVMSACTVAVSDGMKVEVDEPEVSDMRKALVECLFTEGNHNCPSCEKSGRCELQAVGYEVGMVVSRFPYRFPVRERNHTSGKIWLERDRCILCLRCVEFIHDAESGKKIFSLSKRGAKARIEIDTELVESMSAGQVKVAANLCPVGCIIEKGHGFNEPIGQRKYEKKSIRERAVAKNNNE